MFDRSLVPDTRLATRRFPKGWLAALKSERFASRRKLIMGLPATSRRDAVSKSIWSAPRRLAAFVFLNLLEWDMRLKKAALFRNFAARTKVQTRANAGVTITAGKWS